MAASPPASEAGPDATPKAADTGPYFSPAAIDAASVPNASRDAAAAVVDAKLPVDVASARDVRVPADGAAAVADARPSVDAASAIDAHAPADAAPKADTSGPAPGQAGAAALAPAQGALLGIRVGSGSIADREALIGHRMAIDLTFYAWGDDWAGSITKADLAAGRIPLVNWEPAGVDFNDIVSGKLDSTIKARAAGAKALAQRFFLDFAAEMNGDEAWGGNNPPLYVAAYRHIHDIFVAAGATNVVWAWCPNVTDVGGGNKKTMDYYPGDDYVDWTGVDGYNWGSVGGGWQSFQTVFARIYPLLAAKGKPILIGETACASVGGDKAAWIDGIIPSLKAAFPLVKGLVWFDKNKEADWRIDSSPESLAAFQRMASDPYFTP